jgi:hypothetical protein
MLGVEVLEEGDAPHTPGARAETFADERGNGRVFAHKIGPDLAQGHVEAEADFIIGIHECKRMGRATISDADLL